MTSRALYEMARFQVLSAAMTEGPGDHLHDAYVFAWETGIYPYFDDVISLHKPFEAEFAVGSQQMRDLFTMLDEHWLARTVPTFWELEDRFNVRDGGGPWERGTLIYALRYARLSRRFDDAFFAALLKPQQHPTEASLIDGPFDRNSDLGF